MDLREIKALLVLMEEYGLTELEIDDKRKGKLRFVRALQVANSMSSNAEAAVPTAAAPARHVQAPVAAGDSADAQPALRENQRLVKSPMVGTFYCSPAPDSPPFVEEGVSVRKGQTLCIIEAMKMMNEIEAEVAGRIVQVLCDNAQAVEYGQPLMVVEMA